MGANKKICVWLLNLVVLSILADELPETQSAPPTSVQQPPPQQMPIKKTSKKKKHRRKRKNKQHKKKRRAQKKHICACQCPPPLTDTVIDGVAGQFNWPLAKNTYWISSFFGRRNLDDGRGTTFHWGIDLAAITGTPIVAAANGRVIEAGNGNGYGKTILLKHAGGYKTRYAHLNTIKVQNGQMVTGGKSIIGTVGATGNVRANGTSASHLHFEILRHRRHLNPLDYLPQ